MGKQYTIDSLREEIRELEIKQEAEGKVLKAQLKVTYEYLKPSNILRSVVKDIVSSETLKNDFINTAASYTSGLLTKKLIVGKSQNPFLKIIGLGIQFGITALVNKNYNSIKEVFTQYVNAFISNLSDSVNDKFSDDKSRR